MSQPVIQVTFNEPPMTRVEQALVSFLQHILPEGEFFYGTSNISQADFYNDDGTVTHRNVWKDSAHLRFVDMARDCIKNSNAGHNTYIALSAFQQGFHHNAQGKSVFRVQSNAVQQKALWLDVDCGKNNSPYATAYNGLEAAIKFSRSIGLPIPTVVSSGSGLHLYWSFTDTLDTATWRRVAAMLKDLTLHFNFVVDHSRTCDPSSVLRLPTTMNYGRDGAATPVQLMKVGTPLPVIDIVGKLVAAIKANNVQPSQSVAQQSVSPTLNGVEVPEHVRKQFEEQTAHLTQSNNLRRPLKIIEGCKQIQLSGTGTYTQWYNMMLVMKHCNGGKEMVHKISQLDTVRYDEYNTDAKYQQAVDGGYGPALCTTFNQKDPGICQHCPSFGRISSPIVLGEIHRETQKVTLTAPVVAADHTQPTPAPVAGPLMTLDAFNDKEYSVIPGQGVVWHKRALVSGELVDPDEQTKHYVTQDILICETEFYVHSMGVDRSNPSDIQTFYKIRKRLPNTQGEDVEFSITKDSGDIAMDRWFSNNRCAAIRPKYKKQLREFMSTYIAAVQSRMTEMTVRKEFGWKAEDNGTEVVQQCFLWGETLITPQGDTKAFLDKRAMKMQDVYVKSGTLENWKHIPAMYMHLNQYIGQLWMCASFGSALMHFGVGVETNATFSIFNDHGGKGKTELGFSVASVWGLPRRQVLTRGDSASAQAQYFSVRHNMPLVIDEITQMPGMSLMDMVYTIINGKERNKSTASGTDVCIPGTWDTFAFFTTNDGVWSKIRQDKGQGDATLYRVAEYECDFTNYGGTDVADYIRNIIKIRDSNYGHAGPAFIRYLVQNPVELSELLLRAEAIAKDLLKDSAERFWTASLGAALACGEVAVKLGLLPYDMAVLYNWVKAVFLPKLRSTIRETKTSGIGLLTDYLHEKRRSTLMVTSSKRTHAQKDLGLNNPMNMDPYIKLYPDQSLLIRIEEDTKATYVTARDFSKWLVKQGMSFNDTMNQLKDAGILVSENKLSIALGEGVSVLNRGRTQCYRFDGNKLKAVMEV